MNLKSELQNYGVTSRNTRLFRGDASLELLDYLDLVEPMSDGFSKLSRPNLKTLDNMDKKVTELREKIPSLIGLIEADFDRILGLSQNAKAATTNEIPPA